MMQPTLPPSPKAAASIFDAIKDGDWEGLATLYATAAYDAVHAAEFARRGGADFHRQQSSPPSLRAAAAGGPGKGVFRDGKDLRQGVMLACFRCAQIHAHIMCTSIATPDVTQRKSWSPESINSPKLPRLFEN